MSTGSVRAASSKLCRTSAPVKPSPSSVTPGRSSRFAKAMRKRRASALAGPRPIAISPARKIRRCTPGLEVTLSLNRLDIDESAGQADRLRHRHRQEERGPARFRRNIGNWLGLHVLDDVDAVIGNERLVYRESDAFFLARNHFHRPGVGADDYHFLRGEPFRRGGADAGLGAVISGVLRGELLEQIAPAGIDEDGIGLSQRHIVHLESSLQIILADDRAAIEARSLAGGIGLELARRLEHLDDVDDDAARREGLDVLDAELLQPVLGDVLAHRRLIVIAVLDADMAHAVDMRADMALAEIGVLHIAQLVAAEFRAGH